MQSTVKLLWCLGVIFINCFFEKLAPYSQGCCMFPCVCKSGGKCVSIGIYVAHTGNKSGYWYNPVVTLNVLAKPAPWASVFFLFFACSLL